MFIPPESLVRSIGKGRTWIMATFPHSLWVDDESGYAPIRSTISVALNDVYLKKRTPRTFRGRTPVALGEALRNAGFHGNGGIQDKKIEIGCWFGVRGVLIAVRDEGDFFRESYIKDTVESRIPLPSTKDGGAGLACIYEVADIVYVSTEENALYLVLLIKSSRNGV